MTGPVDADPVDLASLPVVDEHATAVAAGTDAV